VNLMPSDTTIPAMATLVMACMIPGCDMGEGVPYKTEKVDAAIAWAMLQTQIATPTMLWRKQARLGRSAPKQNV